MKRPKLGQVFLIDPNVVNSIIRKVELEPKDSVLEIGCGDGILTEALHSIVTDLTVVELDKTCIERTQERLGGEGDISWVHDDILSVDFQTLTAGTRVIANIPYYLSAKLIQKLAYAKNVFKDITIMVQKEFAQKCVAGPGQKDYTSLGVFTQFHFEVRTLFDIPNTCFHPRPKIDSSMLQLIPAHKYPHVQTDWFECLVKGAFWGKRKKVATALRKNPFKPFPAEVAHLPFFQTHSSSRADHLSLDDYVQLYDALVAGSFFD